MKALWQILILLFLVAQNVHATVCRVDAGVVIISGEEYQKGRVITQCTGTAKAKGHTASLSLLDKLGNWKKVPLVSGQEHTVEGLQKGEFTESFIGVLASLWSSEGSVEYGGKHLTDHKSLQSFPYGEILLPAKTLSFSSAQPDDRIVKQFSLYSAQGAGSPVFSVARVSNTISIPADVFRHGTKYRWEALCSDGKVTGRFTIAHQEDQQDFERDLRNLIPSKNATPLTRLLWRAAAAREYGYTFDAQQALDEARKLK